VNSRSDLDRAEVEDGRSNALMNGVLEMATAVKSIARETVATTICKPIEGNEN